MATYVILTQLSPEAFREPAQLRTIAQTVSEKIKTQCPQVHWLGSYALMGRFDVLDIVEATSPAEVEKVAMIIRSYGHSATETLLATPWKEFIAAL